MVKALNHWDAFDGTPKSKAEWQKVQDAFNDWHRAHLAAVLPSCP